MMRSNQRRRISARSLAVLAAQAGWSACAASIAWRSTSTPRLGTVPICASSNGSVTAIVAPSGAASHLPPARHLSTSRLGSLRASERLVMAEKILLRLLLLELAQGKDLPVAPRLALGDRFERHPLEQLRMG